MAMVQQFDGLNRPDAPAVSVCVANYQGELLLTDCLESVLSQECPGGLEIIVHDDASADGSVELLRTRFPQATVLVSGENVGFTVANNRMAAVARGRHLLLLNNDAALQPGALLSLLGAVETLPGAIFTLAQFDWNTGELIDRGCLLDPFFNPVPNLDPDRSEVAMGIGACLFLSRTLWQDLGGLPEWMGSLAEDLYLCGLARLQGHQVRVADGSGYRHRQGQTFGGNRVEAGRLETTTRRRALSERNKTSALVILTPGFLIWPLLGLHLALLATEGLALTVLKRTTKHWRSIYWPAIASTFRNRRMLWALRRHVQAGRHVSVAQYFSTTHWWPRKLALLGKHGLPTIR